VASSVEELYEQALGTDPYPFQERLASRSSLPDALHVPTGAGKTAAVVLGWLWRRRFHSDPEVREATPRRLVYCLPMRVLVEQTAAHARQYLTRLNLLASDSPADGDGVGVHVLMGGQLEEKWVLHPDQDAVLVGTQDMLLSRALNRGYAASRFRWPVEFGLLNADCLWVFDETQLMGVARATSAQLEAFRRKLGTFGPTRSLWMSATFRPEDIGTVDFEGFLEGLDVERLGEGDLQNERLRRRLKAPKTLRFTDITVPSRKSQVGTYLRDLADQVVDRHRPATQTLVVMNTVGRAQDLYDEVLKRTGTPIGPGAEAKPNGEGPDVLLAHSRFRGAERNRLNEHLQEFEPEEGRGRIVVATQVVEAGVDISSRLLFTELAPWPSVVQRMGRCNRYGEHGDAEVRWIDVTENRAPPYEEERLAEARAEMERHTDGSVSPADLKVGALPKPHPVLRRRDLRELFDTEPDLSGNEIDVSPYIRQHEERDASVFWRQLPDEGPPPDLVEPERAELCNVPIGQLAAFLENGRWGWRWDHLNEDWRALDPDDLRPGQRVLLASSAGGYSRERGWSPEADDPVPEARETGTTDSAEGTGDDRYSRVGRWETLEEHTDRVVAELSDLVAAVRDDSFGEALEEALRQAARLHDLGKAHPVFQGALQGEDGEEAPDEDTVWGKAPDLASYERPYFRHELASALGVLEAPELLEEVPERFRPLVPYLVAAHHGKVRTVIRALPGEALPPESGDGEVRFARGVWDGDRLPAVSLGGGQRSPPVTLSLECMELGGGGGTRASWLDRSLRLLERDDLGPFRLGHLEALLRVADWRASGAVSEEGSP
jgi:CRISPR-associated endonuclease/helicase Cas3